jgi:stage V sporulation protein B
MSRHFDSLARGAIVTLVGIVASKFFLIIFEFALVFALGAAGFGNYMICVALIAVVATICQFGIDYAALQYMVIANERDDPEEAARCARIGVLVPTLAAILIALGFYTVSDFIALEVFRKPELVALFPVACLVIPLLAFSRSANAVLRAMRRMSDAVIVFDGLRNFILVASLPLMMIGAVTPLEALWAQVAANAAAVVFALYRLKDHLRATLGSFFDRRVFGEMFGFAKPLILWSVVQNASRELAIIIAGITLFDAEVGIFALAMRFVLVLNMTQNAVNAAAPAEFASLWSARNVEQMGYLYQRTARGLIVVSSVLALPMLVAPQALFSIFGDLYIPYAWILWPLLADKLLTVGSGPAGSVLIAGDRRPVLVMVACIRLALHIVVTLPLALAFGLAGLVAGAALRGFLTLVYTQYVLKRHFGFQAFTRKMFVVIADMVVAVLVGVLLMNGSADLLRFAGVALLSAAVFAGLLWFTARGTLLEIIGPLRARLARRFGRRQG